MPDIFIAPAVEVRELLFFLAIPIGLQLHLISSGGSNMKRLRRLAIAACLLALAPSVTAAAADSLQTRPAQLTFQWLECTQQQPNGQIGSGGNPIARSAEVAMSLAAADQDASTFHHEVASLADFLKAVTPVDVNKTDSPVGTNGELLIARVLQPSAGLTAGPIAQLQLAKSGGEFGGDIFSDALAILGLRAAHQPVGEDAIAFLEEKQNPTDHGWSFDNAGQFGSDSNTTALVIQALLAAAVPGDDRHIVQAFAFMETQFMNGGFVNQADPSKPPSDTSNMPDANSDELGLQAILAAGLQANEPWKSRFNAAKADLAGRQVMSGPDTGALSGFSKLFASTEAPLAFLNRPLTASTKASTQVPLLSCQVTTASSPSPSPSGSPVVQLPRTGGGVTWPPLIWAGLVLMASGVVMWRRKHAG